MPDRYYTQANTIFDGQPGPRRKPTPISQADVAGRLNAIESLANELADILNAIISTGTRLTDDAFREFEDLAPETFDDPLATRAAIIDCFRAAYAKHMARSTGSGNK